MLPRGISLLARSARCALKPLGFSISATGKLPFSRPLSLFESSLPCTLFVICIIAICFHNSFCNAPERIRTSKTIGHTLLKRTRIPVPPRELERK